MSREPFLFRLVLLLALLGPALARLVASQPATAASSSQAEQPRLLPPRASAHLDDHHGHSQEHAHGHECGHSRVSHLQEQSVAQFRAYAASQGLLKGAKRQLSQQSSSGQGGGSAATIRISVQYQLGTSLTTAQQQALQSVVDTAVRVVRKFVKVNVPVTGALQVRNTAVCSPATIPATLRAGPNRGQRDADYVLLVTAQQSSSCPSPSSNTQQAGALTWAMACDYSLDPASLGRPILGVVNLCSGAVKAATDATAAAAAAGGVSGPVVDVLVHELMHALGISSSMYGSWVDSDGEEWEDGGVTTSKGVSYLVTDAAQEAARELLRCDEVPGLPLEDQGGPRSAASHWEYRFFNQELMTPYFSQAGQRLRLSSLTLGALNDTGWYTPRMQYAQHLDLEQLPDSSVNCALATSTCSAFQARSPGAYYCSASGLSPVSGSNSSNSSSNTSIRLSAPPAPPLQCYTPSTPASCETSPFSNGCGVLRPSAVPCTSTNFTTFIPQGTANQMAGIPGLLASSSFYQGLGAYYGVGGTCLTWSNGTGTQFSGCFYGPRCDARGAPLIMAVVRGALVSIPCPPGTTVLLGGYVPVRDAGTALGCPTTQQAADICAGTSSGSNTCGGMPCLHGSCLHNSTCICDLEFMGQDCSLHVSQVSDFDVLGVSQASVIATAVRPMDTVFSAKESARPSPRGAGIVHGDCNPSSGMLCKPANVQVPLSS